MLNNQQTRYMEFHLHMCFYVVTHAFASWSPFSDLLRDLYCRKHPLSSCSIGNHMAPCMVYICINVGHTLYPVVHVLASTRHTPVKSKSLFIPNDLLLLLALTCFVCIPHAGAIHNATMRMRTTAVYRRCRCTVDGDMVIFKRVVTRGKIKQQKAAVLLNY